jgi:hypothetical protein
MGNVDRYKREQDLIFQQIEEMGKRERAALMKMNQTERDKVLIELISSRSIRALLAAVPIEDRQGIIDSCLHAWEQRIAHEESSTSIERASQTNRAKKPS